MTTNDNTGWIYADTAHPVDDKEREYNEQMFGRGVGDPDGYNDGNIVAVVISDTSIEELLNGYAPF